MLCVNFTSRPIRCKYEMQRFSSRCECTANRDNSSCRSMQQGGTAGCTDQSDHSIHSTQSNPNDTMTAGKSDGAMKYNRHGKAIPRHS